MDFVGLHIGAGSIKDYKRNANSKQAGTIAQEVYLDRQ